MNLTLIDTPGFGDQVNNDYWYKSNMEIAVFLIFIVRFTAGNQLRGILRISTLCTCEGNYRRLVINSFPTLEFTAFSISYHQPVIRTLKNFLSQH